MLNRLTGLDVGLTFPQVAASASRGVVADLRTPFSPHRWMPESTLASLAHALAAAPRLEAAFVALAEGMAEVDRAVVVAYLPFDARDAKLVECLTWDQGTVY